MESTFHGGCKVLTEIASQQFSDQRDHKIVIEWIKYSVSVAALRQSGLETIFMR